jgi:DNA repair exonuclease SbcCD ATPase subunit
VGHQDDKYKEKETVFAMSASAIKQIADTPEDETGLREWTRQLESQSQRIRASAEKSARDFQLFREIENKLTRRCEAQAEELKARELEAGTLRSEIEVLKALLEERIKRDTAAEEALQKESVRIKRHEERLRVYAEALEAGKETLRDFARQLAQELREAGTLHPLQDYLAATERELSKVERELRKTPDSAPARHGLEQSFASIIDQRDFLRASIEASRKLIERQAEKVLGIALSPDLEPMPPTPPAPSTR